MKHFLTISAVALSLGLGATFALANPVGYPQASEQTVVATESGAPGISNDICLAFPFCFTENP